MIIWDQDVVGAIVRGIHAGGTGIFNLAGDGTLTLREMARDDAQAVHRAAARRW